MSQSVVGLEYTRRFFFCRTCVLIQKYLLYVRQNYSTVVSRFVNNGSSWSLDKGVDKLGRIIVQLLAFFLIFVNMSLDGTLSAVEE